MGANAQTSVPTFTAGEVLTAANMNISARTGVPVFSNTTTRDAGFGGTGEKTLAEGQLCYLEDSNVVQYYDGAAWATVGPASSGALVRTGGGALSGASTTISNVFSATYTNYIVTVSDVRCSTDVEIYCRMGATSTGYYYSAPRAIYSTGAYNGQTNNNSGQWSIGTSSSTVSHGQTLFFGNPYLSQETSIQGIWLDIRTTGGSAALGGFLDNNTSYTDIYFAPSSGTFSSGTVNVYGLALS